MKLAKMYVQLLEFNWKLMLFCSIQNIVCCVLAIYQLMQFLNLYLVLNLAHYKNIIACAKFKKVKNNHMFP